MTRKLPSPGDVIETATGELYVYLGYYKGHPMSIYDRPDEGYLYVFVVYVFVGSARWDKIVFADLHREVYFRIRHDIDGSACYVKSPKSYEKRAGYVRLDPEKIKHAFGLTRLGDRKPAATAQN